MNGEHPVYDGSTGTVGGIAFGAALERLATANELDAGGLASASEIEPRAIERIFAGELRIGIVALARLARAMRVRPIEFLQRTELLSLEVYAFGLDPLYFLPPGQTRYDARIYMREINPRHAVPEGDMTKRNPTLRALAEDTVLDALGKLEVEFAYLLRAAVQGTGGRL